MKTTKSTERLEALAVVAVATLAALVLAASWRRWLDPIVDLGRDLYIPEAMAGGARLYADLLYFYPPLTPSLLAGVVMLFGSSLALYAVIGIATAGVAAGALYAVVRTTAGWPAAASVLVAFTSLHLAGTSTWGANFVFPYAHAATFAMTFFLLFAAGLTHRLFGGGAAISAWSAVIFGVLAASTKIEYVPAVGLVILVAVLVYRLPLRYLAGVGLGWLLMFGLASLAFRGAEPGHHWLGDNVLASSLLTGDAAAFFYSRVSGTASVAASLGRALIGTLLVAAVVALLAVAERAQRRGSRGAVSVALLAAALAVVLLSGSAFFWSWPVLLVALVPIAVRERSSSPLAFLLALAIGTAVRIFFSLGPWWYGFVLALPSYALVAYVLSTWLPARGVYRRRFAVVWLVLAILVAGRGLAESIPRWRARSVEVLTARGAYLDEPGRAQAIASLLEWLEGRSPGETLAVMPEGLAINYFSARRTPLSFHTFTPIEIDDGATERRILRELSERPPDLVVIVPRAVREFGYRGFGVDYARGIATTLRGDYTLAWRSGTRPEIVVLARRGRN